MPQVIATGVISGPAGVALVDPGPTSSLAGLTAGLESAGISWRDVTTLLITHIHLDHSGACGTLVRDHPALRIYVHEKGAPHMVNPEKLLASATRLYGDDMDRLWGEVLPVPETESDDSARRRTSRRGRADARSGVYARPRVASRELLRARCGYCVCRRYGRRQDSRAVTWCRRRRLPTSTSRPGTTAWLASNSGTPRRSSSRISARPLRSAPHLSALRDRLDAAGRLVEGVAGARGDRRSARGVVHRGSQARPAPDDERERRAPVRSRRPVRSQLAWPGAVLEEERNRDPEPV